MRIGSITPFSIVWPSHGTKRITCAHCAPGFGDLGSCRQFECEKDVVCRFPLLHERDLERFIDTRPDLPQVVFDSLSKPFDLDHCQQAVGEVVGFVRRSCQLRLGRDQISRGPDAGDGEQMDQPVRAVTSARGVLERHVDPIAVPKSVSEDLRRAMPHPPNAKKTCVSRYILFQMDGNASF